MTRNFRYFLSFTFIFFLFLIPLLPVLFSEEEEPEASGEFRAVLIGIDDYKSWPKEDNFAPLNYCVKDIEAIHGILKQNGYKDENITIVKEETAGRNVYPATKSIIEDRILNVLESCKRNDVLLIYFSGHGIHLDGQNYLVPYDGRYISEDQTSEERSKRKETLINVFSIYALLANNCEAKTKYFITDACQKNILVSNKGSDQKAKSEFRISAKDVPPGLIQISSCSAGESSFERNGHGLFSAALIAGIQDKADANEDGRITITELFHYVSREVPKAAESQYGEPQNPSMESRLRGGEIVFAYNPAKMKANALKQESQKLLSESRKETLSEKEKESQLETALEKLAEAEKIWPGGEYDYLKQDIQKELAGLTGVRVQKLTDEAWELYQSKDYKEALAKINEALEQDTENISNKAIKKLIETALAPKASPSSETSSTTVSPSEMVEGLSAGTKKTIRIKGIEYTFCWCPAGTFEMGSPESEKYRRDNETQHTVTLSEGFWLLEHEVTLEMFRSFMESTSYKMGDGYEGKGGCGYNAEKDEIERDPKYTWENPGFSQDDDHPVTNVDWAGAKAFCKWLSQESGEKIDLPSEAEWEYACRAGTTSPFNFGGVLNGDQANCDGDYPYGTDEKGPDLRKTTRVKSYSPNAWGLYDMHGNVFEWCNDWYDSDYYTNSPSTDPTGPDSGSNRVNRGGSWDFNALLCRSAIRGRRDPAYRIYNLGFRLALSSTH